MLFPYKRILHTHFLGDSYMLLKVRNYLLTYSTFQGHNHCHILQGPDWSYAVLQVPAFRSPVGPLQTALKMSLLQGWSFSSSVPMEKQQSQDTKVLHLQGRRHVVDPVKSGSEESSILDATH
jgi:hypothetical protein